MASGSQWWPDTARIKWPGVAAVRSYEIVACQRGQEPLDSEAEGSTVLGAVTR
jgi:hypothetical protein